MKWLQSLLKDSPDASQTVEPASRANNAGTAQTPEPVGSATPGDNSPAEEPHSAAGINPPIMTSALVETQEIPVRQVAPSPDDNVSSDRPGRPADAVEAAYGALATRLETMAAVQAELGSRQHDLKELFESRLRSDDVQARLVEKLHDELKQYKASFVRQQIVPVLKEVIFCHDFAAREIERMRQEPAAESPAARSLEVLRQMLVDLLFKYDVEPYRGDGDTFDARTQQCTRTIPTENSEQDKKIAAVILDGFRSPEGIIRREQVAVYKLALPSNNSAANDPGAS